MTPYFVIKKREGNSWNIVQEFGFFNSTIEANEKIYNMIENKNDFWEHYRVVQYEKNVYHTPPQRVG
jgi:hypothetical protein